MSPIDKLKTTESKEPLTKPFLSLPFRKQDLPITNGVPYFEITQAWKATKDDQEIAKIASHEAIDYKVAYGTIVCAPCDCWVIASIQEGWRTVKVKEGEKEIEKDVLFKGEKVAYGGGLFLELIPEDDNIRIQFLHLSEVLSIKDVQGNEVQIPFSKPKINQLGELIPTSHNEPLSLLKDKKMVVFVKKGTPIGKVGYSGLGLGKFMDYKGEDRPPVLPEGHITPWDPADAHLHFEVMKRSKNAPYGKVMRFDPYGINGEAELYPTPLKKLKVGQNSLFLQENNEIPFAA